MRKKSESNKINKFKEKFKLDETGIGSGDISKGSYHMKGFTTD